MKFYPSGHAHFWPRGHHMNKSERAINIDHSYQVSLKSSRRFMRRFVWEFDLLFNGSHFGFGDDLHFKKNEQASHTDHYHEVWPISAKLFTRRCLKYLVKEQPFDLTAAILDDLIIWFRQTMLQSDRLVDTFDLIYYMTIFFQKWNLTPIWPLGPHLILTGGHHMNKSETAINIDHSYQVSLKSN